MGDKPNRLLARKLNPRPYNPALPKLRLQTGQITQNPQLILQEFYTFYSKLYDSPKDFNINKAEEFLRDISLPTLSSDHIERMEAEFTMSEVAMAIKSLNPSKSPGPDGFSGHYYRKYAEILSPHLCAFYNSLRKGLPIPLHENKAFIHVIPKPNKDHGDCANYRPISLINVDLKILTKILTTRMNSFISKYIHPDQTGFVPNRQAPDQTRRIIDIISALNSGWDGGGRRGALLVSLDLHKAFDSLSWDYLFYILGKYGFGSHFLTTLKTIYSHPTANLVVKGYKSQNIQILRGTRQGCPLSPLLFILALEPLAIKIREHQDILGVKCGDREHKCAMFADDILLLLSSPVTSLPNLQLVLRHFTEFSGLKVNQSKTQALNVSLQTHIVQALQQSYPFKWQKETMSYLGIFLTPTLTTLYKHNYPPLFRKILEDIKKWSNNPPSWFGRLCSIKMTVLPKVLYLFRTLPIAVVRNDLQKFQKKLLDFVWGYRRPRVNRRTLYTPKQMGGLGMPDLLKYYQAAQMSQLIKFHTRQPRPLWMSIESSLYPDREISQLMWLKAKDRPAMMCPSLSFSLNLWDRLSTAYGFRSQHNPLAPLFGNTLFTPGLQPRNFLWWTNKGLIRIADYCDHRGALSKSTLQEKYEFPNSELFRFTQIRHFLATLNRTSDITTFTPMENLCRNFDKHTGHISRIYNILTSSISKMHYMQKWEQDMEMELDMEVWNKIILNASKSLVNTSMIEANYKVMMRWYMVPERIATFVPGASPRCFRGCNVNGTFYHTWWTCPKVRRFWIRTYNLIYSLTQANLVKSPLHALLGRPVEGTSKSMRRLITFIFVAARISIAKSWKSPTVPFYLLKAKLSWIMINERLTAILKDKMTGFNKTWDPWIEYLTNT